MQRTLNMSFLSIFNPIASVVDDLTLSEEERKKLEIELERVKTEGQNHIIDAYSKVSEAEAKITTASLKLREAEIKSDGWLTRNIRPALWFLFSLPILWNYVVLPMLLIFVPSFYKDEIIPLPPEFWTLYQGFAGIYTGGRTLEKITQYIKK